MMNNQVSISPEIVSKMITDKAVRTAITKQSHMYFFCFYFAHYIKYPLADFHKEILTLTEDELVTSLFIVAARGFGKSTIVTTSYPLWAILGKQQKKYVLIISRTQSQGKQIMMNIRRELENNNLLRNDLGPFKEDTDEWGSSSLVFSNTNARITVVSVEQSARGLRHNEHRPDLIIGDDVEDIDSTRTQEGRNKTYEWWTSEIVPSGDRNTKYIIVGNLLHQDSLLMRIKNSITLGQVKGIFKEYPLIRDGVTLWPGKYHNEEVIEEEKQRAGNEISWQREYLLMIVNNEDQIIKQEHIHYYDEIINYEYRFSAVAVDPARSLKETADYTAIVSGQLYGYGKDTKLYILPNPVNDRLTTEEMIQKIKSVSYASSNDKYFSRVYVEDVGFQGVITDLLKVEGIPAKPFPVRGWSKEDRLMAVSSLIELGKVVFPRKGAEVLINQILGFGRESHDDLVDACTMLILQVFTDSKRPVPKITWVDSRDIFVR